MIRYALIFSNRVPGTLGVRWEYTVHVYTSTFSFTQSHLRTVMSSPACFGEAGGNQRTQKKPVETQGERKRLTRAQDRIRNCEGVRWQHCTHCSTIHEALFCILYLFNFISIYTVFYISCTYLLNINVMIPDTHATKKIIIFSVEKISK